MDADPPLNGLFYVEGVQTYCGLACTSGPSVAWMGRGLEYAERVAMELCSRQWRRVALVWYTEEVRHELLWR